VTPKCIERERINQKENKNVDHFAKFQLLAAVNNITHSKKIGLGYGLMLSIGWFGNFLGSFFGGYLASLYSANMFFILSVVLLTFIVSLAVIMKLKYKI